jgi:hypothetical protein
VFDQVIQEAIEGAGCVIVLWSESSVQSDWVRDEADEGKRRGILVPAAIDDVNIPMGFRRIQTERLVDWEGDAVHPSFQRLLRAVADKLLSSPKDES